MGLACGLGGSDMIEQDQHQAALDVEFDFEDYGAITVRQYLRMLLTTLWEEGEGFSGKRPFGNSGWEYDLYRPLIKAKFIGGQLDEDGWIESIDDPRTAHAFVSDLIIAAFGV